MSRNFTPSDQKSAYPAVSGEAFVRRNPPKTKYPHLQELRAVLRDSGSAYLRLRNAVGAIDADQFEMLEAELQNQGILPRVSNSSYKLSQRASYDAQFWRWRAKRYGAQNVELRFLVDVPKFILSRSEEILEALDNNEFAKESAAEQTLLQRASARGESTLNPTSELRYLDQFAAYVMGEFDDSTNRYHQGLNLVLKVLSISTRPPSETGSMVQERVENISGVPHFRLTATLPLDKEEFFYCLKSTRNSSL